MNFFCRSSDTLSRYRLSAVLKNLVRYLPEEPEVH